MRIKESQLRKIIVEELKKSMLVEAGTSGKDFLGDPERYMKAYLKAFPTKKEEARTALENVKKASNEMSKYVALRKVIQDLAQRAPKFLDISDLGDLEKAYQERAKKFQAQRSADKSKQPKQHVAGQ